MSNLAKAKNDQHSYHNNHNEEDNDDDSIGIVDLINEASTWSRRSNFGSSKGVAAEGADEGEAPDFNLQLRELGMPNKDVFEHVDFLVNKRDVNEYFMDRGYHLQHMSEPFMVTDTLGQFDVWCSAKGGGKTGQSGAIRLGISRALQNYNPNFRPALKAAGLLTRDARIVERKKPGQAKARKKFQWVKR